MSLALISKKRVLLFTIIYVVLFANLHANYDQQKSTTNIALSVDALAWLASEEVSAIYADVITTGNNSSSWEALSFDFKWDYGFRLGVGTCFCNSLESNFYWTRFCTDASHRISQNPNADITPEFFAAFLSGDRPQSMKVSWEIDFNMFDLEFGKRFCISSCLSLRPFIGVKGGWIDQTIKGTYYDLTISNMSTNEMGTEDLQNDFWAIGTMGGICTNWTLKNWRCHSFELFGDFSTATLWGTWKNTDNYINTASQTSSVNMKDSNLGALMFRGFMGFEWKTNYISRCTSFSAKIGYEMQIWFNQLRLATFQLQRLHGDLTFQGVTLNCQLDF